MIAQIWIAVFGLMSSFLVYCRSERVRRWAPVLALLAQPAWYISCYEAKQWGVMVLTVAYTGFHLRGLWTLWVRKAVLVPETGQLPKGMEHCTIQFKECKKGHGRLTAMNWIDHGCLWCVIEQLKASIAPPQDYVPGDEWVER